MKNNIGVGGKRMSVATIAPVHSPPSETCSSSSSTYYPNNNNRAALSPGSGYHNSRRRSASAVSPVGVDYANDKWFNSHCDNGTSTGRTRAVSENKTGVNVYPPITTYGRQSSPQRPRFSVADFRHTINVNDQSQSSTPDSLSAKFSKPQHHPFLAKAYRNDTIESSFSFEDLSPTEQPRHRNDNYYANRFQSNVYTPQRQECIDALLLLDNMHQRQLIVPPAAHGKSHSTPSSPKLLIHTQSEKDCLNSKNNQMNSIAVPVPVRKHSYDDRMTARGDEMGCRIIDNGPNNLHLPSHPGLGRNHSVGTFSIRRKLPQTPNEHEIVKDKSLSCQPFESDWSLSVGDGLDVKRNSIASSIPESTSSTSTTASSGKASDEGIVIRPGTGRKLPLAPDFSREIKTEGYKKQWQQDERTSLERPCKTPPPSKCIQTACYTYPPEQHNSRTSSPYNRKYCQRRTSEQSIDQYVGIPCTCATPPPPCLTISEHFESKSSSDTEDNNSIAILSHDIPDIEIIPLTDQQFECDPDDKSYGLGKLLFCIQYFPIRKRLRVSIIRATNLAGQLKPDLDLNTFVKICLEPGKVQKQRSARIVKGTRNAVYNEEYFFDNIAVQDMKTKNILIRVCHNGLKQFQKDVVIGELDIPLLTLPTVTTKKEKRLCRELRPKLVKKLGRIHFTTLLEKDARRLTINILKVDNLPKYGISGPPDPCVRITVDQSGKSQTKQTRIMKATCNASFKESVMFLVATRLSDFENTTIDICVHDTARSTATDDLIGRVTLGCHCRDKSLIEQWRNTFMNHGKEYKASCVLKKDETP